MRRLAIAAVLLVGCIPDPAPIERHLGDGAVCSNISNGGSNGRRWRCVRDGVLFECSSRDTDGKLRVACARVGRETPAEAAP